LLDPKETGFLTLENLQDIVASSGEPLTDEEVKLMFQDADIDGDGKVAQPVTHLCRPSCACASSALWNRLSRLVISVELPQLPGVHEGHWHFVVV
jgi:hypothetical protein